MPSVVNCAGKNAFCLIMFEGGTRNTDSNYVIVYMHMSSAALLIGSVENRRLFKSSDRHGRGDFCG